MYIQHENPHEREKERKKENKESRRKGEIFVFTFFPHRLDYELGLICWDLLFEILFVTFSLGGPNERIVVEERREEEKIQIIL